MFEYGFTFGNSKLDGILVTKVGGIILKLGLGTKVGTMHSKEIQLEILPLVGLSIYIYI
jgi:hypothetical protein